MAERICSIDGCDKKHDARGLCHTHYCQVWSRKNRASVNESKTRWRLANPEKMKAARTAWKKKNLEAVRASRRAVKKRHPHANRSYVRVRKARKRQLSVVPFTPAQLQARLSFFGHRCWMCGSDQEITLDHVKPLSKGGAHILCNLRPACGPCNYKKGTQWPYEIALGR